MTTYSTSIQLKTAMRSSGISYILGEGVSSREQNQQRIESLDREELVKRCAAKDALAQKELYDRYAAKLFPICMRYAGNKMDAEDVLQEAFIKIFAHISKLKSPEALEGWMKRIIVNTSLKLISKRKRAKDSADLDDVIEYSKEVGPISEMSEQEILNLVSNLPSGYRTVFNLYAIEGFKHKEIAEILQIEESTSRTQLLKARKLLMKKLSGWSRLLT